MHTTVETTFYQSLDKRMDMLLTLFYQSNWNSSLKFSIFDECGVGFDDNIKELKEFYKTSPIIRDLRFKCEDQIFLLKIACSGRYTKEGLTKQVTAECKRNIKKIVEFYQFLHDCCDVYPVSADKVISIWKDKCLKKFLDEYCRELHTRSTEA